MSHDNFNRKNIKAAREACKLFRGQTTVMCLNEGGPSKVEIPKESRKETAKIVTSIES